jgi:hypothetical protein
MAKEICVFCGEEMGYIRSEYVSCGPVSQWACKSCVKEVEKLTVEERCRRALQRGLAVGADSIREYLEKIEHAEEVRPACVSCGGPLKFKKHLVLHNISAENSLNSKLESACAVVPAACKQCGRMEFFDYDFVYENGQLLFLMKKDTENIG